MTLPARTLTPSSNDPPSADDAARRRRSRRGRRSHALIAGLVALAALGAAFAPAHPTGHPVIDVIERAAFAALVTLAASRSARWTWLVLAALTVIFSRGVWLVPAFAAAAVALAAAWQWRRHRRLGAVMAALAVQALLRLPPIGFHGLTAIVAAAATLPVLVSGYRLATVRTRRVARRTAFGLIVAAVVCTVPLVVAAVLSRAKLLHGISAAETALNSVGTSNQSAAEHSLDDAARSFHDAGQLLGSWWTAPAALVPVVSQHRQVVDRTAATAHGLASDAAGTVAEADYDRLQYRHGTLDLTQVSALTAPLTSLRRALSDAHGQLAGLRTSWVVPQLTSRIHRFQDEIDKALPQTDLAIEGVKVAPGLLGGSGPRHYFVAFTTPAEQRGLGGFVGSYAEILADQGHLTMVRSGPISELGSGTKSVKRSLTGPADYLARYGPFDPAHHFQDVTYSPDLPTVAEVISQLYPQATGDHIDGVLVVDPYGLAALLKITGPVSVAGLPEKLTAANAADVLLRTQYEQYEGAGSGRKDALADASRDVFDRLTTGNLPAPKTLADTLSAPVHQGRIGFYSFHPDEERFIERIHLDRTFPRPDGGDLLAVTTQNVANSKIDVYLHRSIDDRVQVDPGTGQVHSTATVTLHNAAPATGLPPEVSGTAADPSLPPGTNRTFVSVYSPLQLQTFAVDGTAAPVNAQNELGWQVYATTVSIPPGGTVTLTLDLAGQLSVGARYHLTLPVQPQVNPDRVTVQVVPAGGWTMPAGTGRWSALDLQEPRTLSVHLQRPG